MKEAVKIKLKTTVKKSFYDEETKKLSLNLLLSDEMAEKIEDEIIKKGLEWSGDKYPIKESGDGIILKASTVFPPASAHIPSGYTYSDIGAGTELTAYISLKEGEYRRKKYVSAYLSGVDVINFEPVDLYSPFDDESFSEIEDAEAKEAPVEESR